MAGGERDKQFNLAMRMNGYQSDLQRQFTKRSHNPYSEEIELSLGLSMNGRFGVDPVQKRLKRSSSSIANVALTAGRHAPAVGYENHALLGRTQSLPTETEEEMRRRKVMQSMRRMEAKKRIEKLRVMRGGNEGAGNGGHVNSENASEISSSEGSTGSMGISDEGAKQNSEAPPVVQPRYQDQSVQKPIIGAIVKSAPAVQPSLQDQSVQKPIIGAIVKSEPQPASYKKPAIQSLNDPLLDMPYVCTKVDGPNDKKIEGFLYRYKKNEEVRIVCVCHGDFLTPAEFVKHGGGGDVEQPLKHIVVQPFHL